MKSKKRFLFILVEDICIPGVNLMKCRNKPKDSGFSVPSTGVGRAVRPPEQRTEGQYQLFLLGINLFFRLPLMKSMERYLESLTDARHSSCTRGGVRKRDQNSPRKQIILCFCGHRELAEQGDMKWYGEKLLPVQWEEQLDPADPSSLFWSVLPLCGWPAREIEADPSSAAINKFSSKNLYSNANLSKLKTWLVVSLLLDMYLWNIFWFFSA